MKISYNWLKDYLNIDLDPVKMGEILTDIGLEIEWIEEYESVPGGLKGLVVGHVKECEKHPDADRLNVTKVDLGKEELAQIVCGAPNVAIGQKVVVAQPGDTIFPLEGDPFKIKKAKIRGVESLGMICAEDEIGLGVSHDGIIVLNDETAPGTPAFEVFNVSNDTVFEIGLTPNRSDAMSHIGVAKDVMAYLQLHHADEEYEITEPVTELTIANNNAVVEVVVEDQERCPRYAGLTISGITVGESPEWLKNKLAALGIRSINNVVDATNFVLWEFGQPLHAFDLNQVNGKVVVKTLDKGTKFTTLDEEEIELSEEDLMICNGSEGMCLAGVFGGIKSGVKDDTTAIFLESAYFNSTSIRRTSQRHGLRTDAAVRYEKGGDPSVVLPALKRAAKLITDLAGGEITMDIIDLYPTSIEPAKFTVKYDYINKLIGEVLAPEKIHNILTALEIEVSNKTDESFDVAVTTAKVDVTRPADIVEEILRIYGFNNVALPEQLSLSVNHEETPSKQTVQTQLIDLLIANGYFEVKNNSLVNSKYLETIADETHVPVLNYSSKDLDIMRPNLFFSNLDTTAFNLNRKNNDLLFFELGKSYHKGENGYYENEHLLLTAVGRKNDEKWNTTNDKVDFFFLKGQVEQILRKMGLERFFSKEISENPFEYGIEYFQKGKEDRTIVRFGKVAKKVAKNFGVKEEVFMADFDFNMLLEAQQKNKVKFKEIAKFPSSRRDLALLVDKAVRFEDIKTIATKTDKKLLKSVDLFDVYEGKNLEEGKKSYAVSFIFRNDQQTITDKDVDKIMDRLIDTYEKQLNAKLR